MINFSCVSNSEWIAAASFIVAIFAMVATFWQASIARKYSRISVRPHLDWGIDQFPSKPTVLYIFNSGLGSAIIDSITLIFDGKRNLVTNMNLPNEIREEISKIENCYPKWIVLSPGTPVLNGERIELFSFGHNNSNSQAINFLKRLDVEVYYSSMYGEKSQPMQTDTKCINN